MTARKQTKTGARKSKKLRVNKQTLRDLAPGKGKAGAVVGGRVGKTFEDQCK